MNHSATETPESEPSLLGTIAHHEERMLARLDAAKQKAGEIIAFAQASVASFVSTEAAHLEEDISAMYQAAESERRGHENTLLETAKQKAAVIREQALKRVPETANTIAERVLPHE